MKTIMVMYDTLNRHHLPNYGCDWTVTPNFRRLGERTVTFDRSYVCSMPCMPARRDLHTGRPNFLHLSWGPMEPYCDSMFEELKQEPHHVYSHLTTDHYHYFEDGGLNYHQRYSTWQFNRGQEGDPWIGQVADPCPPESVYAGYNGRRKGRQDWINRDYLRHEEEHYQTRTFRDGMEFIFRNRDEDNWFLQIETFDPHEPYFSHRKYKDLYAEHYDRYQGRHFDWPPYGDVRQTPQELEHLRYEYGALLSQCDANLGQILRVMDEYRMWDDTMLIVWTDHGFLLGERDMLGKVSMPFYEEVAHTPFFVWDPRFGKRNERRQALVQPSIDLAPTIMNFHGAASTADMTGKDLAPVIADDTPVRDVGIFGVFGGQVNVTDGRYVYMRGAANTANRPLNEYRLISTYAMQISELREMELAGPFSFTKGCQVMKIPILPSPAQDGMSDLSTKLFDLENDPKQQRPINDPEIERRMTGHLIRLMKECDSPPDQFERLGLEQG